ncbi:MAG: cysteine hydrolase [Gammaproteobacteria bacterium]|nr:MAG: cysteine hydrolase [Gammaproteobacteria bacterium]
MDLRMQTALVILDQQKGIDNPKLGPRNNKNAQAEILKLLVKWRELEWPIFHVRHRSTHIDSVFWPDQDGFEFKPEFVPLDNEAEIEKRTPCAFINTNLQSLLNQNGITSVVVVGASTNNSIEASVRTGSCLGFTIMVIEDACFAFAKRDYFGIQRSAEEVHAMSLANLNGEYARVVRSADLIFGK